MSLFQHSIASQLYIADRGRTVCQLDTSCCAPVPNWDLSPQPMHSKSDTLRVDDRHFEILRKFVADMIWRVVDVVTMMFCCVQGVWRETAVSDTCWLLHQPRRVSYWFHGICLSSVQIYFASFHFWVLLVRVVNKGLILSRCSCLSFIVVSDVFVSTSRVIN